MRASEARQKLCPFSFGLREIPHVLEGGPTRCLTDQCMAWNVYRAVGSKSYQADSRPIPNGFEIDPDAPKRVGNVGIRATEDHGECHAMPARPE